MNTKNTSLFLTFAALMIPVAAFAEQTDELVSTGEVSAEMLVDTLLSEIPWPIKLIALVVFAAKIITVNTATQSTSQTFGKYLNPILTGLNWLALNIWKDKNADAKE